MDRVVSELAGGLGNQMFCYATGYAVAKKFKCQYQMDLSSYAHDTFERSFQLNKFNISATTTKLSRETTIDKIKRKVALWKYNIVASREELRLVGIRRKNLYLTSTWHVQDFRIFDNYRESILSEFRYNDETKSVFDTILEKEKYYNVAIHFRFGDYERIGCCISEQYYYDAIKKIQELLKNAEISKNIRYLIFSENIDKAKKILDSADVNFPVFYISSENHLTDLEEFQLMRLCDSIVISNSTFSWWAAYLQEITAEQIVVAPVIHSWIEECWEETYFPDNWHKITSELQGKLKQGESHGAK